MKNLLTAAILAFSIAGFTACSDNDEDVKPGPSPAQTAKIDGDWKGLIIESLIRDANGNIVGAKKIENHTAYKINFSGNSVTATYPYRDTTKHSSGTFTLNGNLLNMQVPVNAFVPDGEYVIDSLNAHRLVIHYKGGYSNSLGGRTELTARTTR